VRRRLRRVPVPVRAALQRVLDEKLVHPDVVVDRDLCALGDRFRFHRVVTNVVENAQRHGGGVVLVRAYARDDRCVIEVDDDGPGIPAAELDGIFDRFHKVDRSRSSHGSGLGLAIAREHARALGGSLQAENRERGARFVFTLPRATAA